MRRLILQIHSVDNVVNIYLLSLEKMHVRIAFVDRRYLSSVTVLPLSML